ncbi:MAG: ABC transporter permease [Alphaproteobacteria bacterium]|nr:ABC transporter permease [Alphaproteobacteria bacterium]
MSMSSSNTVPEAAPVTASAEDTATRPFFWSVKRELWEHSSLYYAPLGIAGLMLFGFVLSLFGIARHAKDVAKTMTPDSIPAMLILPYDITAVAVIVGSVVVGLFYCLSALYNERRERSILFWKSLPVSNLTTVLSKVFVPLVVLPVIVSSVVTAMHVIMLLLNVIGRTAAGLNVGELIANVPLFQMEIVLLYGVLTLALWHAPIYAWFILVSAWAKKTPILWAVLPPIALAVVERVAFNTGYIGRLISYRIGGALNAAFSEPGHLPMKPLKMSAKAMADAAHHGFQGIPVFGLQQIDLLHFLATPGLWAGLIVAAAMIAGAIWLRRTGEAL